MPLSEADIRPKHFDDLRFAAQKKDVARLAARVEEFVSSDCVACGATESQPKHKKFGFNWDQCGKCGTVFMNPRPPVSVLGDFYAGSELYKVWNEVIFPASAEVRRKSVFQPRVERLLDIFGGQDRSPGTLIEVGAAHGLFCEEAVKTGRFDRVIAIEPSEAQARSCRARGLETIEATAESSTGLDQSADAVAAFETIEHVSDPGAFLAQIVRFLKPGGLLVLTTPNSAGFDVELLGTASDQVYPEHVTLFTPRGLEDLLETAGLETMELTTPGKLDCDIVRNKVLSGEVDLSGNPFLSRVLIEQWYELGEPFQSFLADNGLSSHMWAIARKPQLSN
ncbi:MAG: class I SAM-dependent methyltransferase [Hoeflea sp.]|uniref:class I SAM-dependent methyltransferase n=1 Tax=Hoeflea sp. TaxID=1940281 RepID=UPI0032992E36